MLRSDPNLGSRNRIGLDGIEMGIRKHNKKRLGSKWDHGNKIKRSISASSSYFMGGKSHE